MKKIVAVILILIVMLCTISMFAPNIYASSDTLSVSGYNSIFTENNELEEQTDSELVEMKSKTENELKDFTSSFTNISRISLVGYGIVNNENIIKKTLEILNINSVDIFSMQLEECKLSIMTKEKVSNKLLEQLHHELV